MLNRIRPVSVPTALCLGLVLVLVAAAATPPAAGAQNRPNILFIILDDVGIDQFKAFNPMALDPPRIPVMDALMTKSVRFTNMWTMPECSPSRTCFFTGRFPFRTGVNTALTSIDLPQVQISPYEVTTPLVLAKAGYASALIGKYHLGGPDNNPAGYGAPQSEGWDYFNGLLFGSPPPIDTTLGGQISADISPYDCGFPTGDQRGACWFLGKDGVPFCDDNNGAGYTGVECVTRGGVPALDVNGAFAATCADAGSAPEFDVNNGYYVWPHTINSPSGVTTGTSREYMLTQQTNAAVEWIQEQRSTRPGQPWMCTVSYGADHDPYQEPPAELLPPGFVWPDGVPRNCTDEAAERVLSNLMIYAMDQEIGRLLKQTGLARPGTVGGNRAETLGYEPESTDTMIIVLGDNGTFYPVVQSPYDPLRAKATVYETGVRAPLFISGPLVEKPGRAVDAMVNCVDIFQLFAEIAGLRVRQIVPSTHVLDCQPFLPFLKNPDQPAFRTSNFTQIGSGLKSPENPTWPCVIQIGSALVCNESLFATQSLCETTGGGEWFGPTDAEPVPKYPTCCAVQQNVYPNMSSQPKSAWAVTNGTYKLVRNQLIPCENSADTYEFYNITPTPKNPVGLDTQLNDLLVNGQPTNLTPVELSNYKHLRQLLNQILASEPPCFTDGNLDKKIDRRDYNGVIKNWGQPSRFDFDKNGVTNGKDLACVTRNLGLRCLTQGGGDRCK